MHRNKRNETILLTSEMNSNDRYGLAKNFYYYALSYTDPTTPARDFC